MWMGKCMHDSIVSIYTGSTKYVPFELLPKIIVSAIMHFLSSPQTKHILSQLYPGSILHLQCTCEEIDYICDEFNFLSQAKETILIMEAYNPTINGEISWIQTNLPQPDSSMPLLQRFVQYVHNEPVGLWVMLTLGLNCNQFASTKSSSMRWNCIMCLSINFT